MRRAGQCEHQLNLLSSLFPPCLKKLIPELQKLFVSKNETNVLKLWPLFVKLLGKVMFNLYECLSRNSESPLQLPFLLMRTSLRFPDSCCTKEVRL